MRIGHWWHLTREPITHWGQPLILGRMRLGAKMRINHQRADNVSFLSWKKNQYKELKTWLHTYIINKKMWTRYCPPWRKVGTKENILSRQRLVLAELATWVFKSWGTSDFLTRGRRLAWAEDLCPWSAQSPLGGSGRNASSHLRSYFHLRNLKAP